MTLPNHPSVVYAVADVTTDRILYAGTSLYIAAIQLKPGTVYAKSQVKHEAVRLAHLRVEREKARLKTLGTTNNG